MALVVNSNIAAVNSQRNLGISNNQLSKSLEKLSSGLRINRAADDAAGLAIATKFGAQVRGVGQAVRNANNAISLVQTAEGGVNNLTNILQRLRELAVQSSSDDNTQSDRDTITSEADNLISEFTRVANTTEFNTLALLDGTFTGRFFQVGANYSQTITFDIGDARGKSIGGRAQYDADVANGLTNALNGGFGGSEVKINGYGVQATSSTDDQYSVLEISSSTVADASATLSATTTNSILLQINDVSVNIVVDSTYSGASMVDAIVSAVNAAAITNVSAVEIDSTVWVLRAKAGTDVELAVSVAGSDLKTNVISAFGWNASLGGIEVSAMVGSTVGSSNDIISANGQSSALAKAVAINSIKSNSLVTATVQKNTVTGTSAVTAGTISSGYLYINGVNIGAVTTTANDGTGALVSAINAVKSTTGVEATTNSDGKLILSATDGRNVTLSTATSGVRTLLNIDTGQYVNGTAIFRSTVRLTSENEISLTGTLADLYDSTSNDYTKTTDTSKSTAVDESTYNIDKIKVNTQDTAQAAILTIDAALNDLNLLRSQIGAIQNRLEFTVANLEIASENFSASESRIKDADFAYETTRFTRSQILSQAGTAMLAQANTLPQVALQLLR